MLPGIDFGAGGLTSSATGGAAANKGGGITFGGYQGAVAGGGVNPWLIGAAVLVVVLVLARKR